MTRLTPHGFSGSKAHSVLEPQDVSNKNSKVEDNYKLTLLWRGIIFVILIHLEAIYGLYLMCVSAKIQSLIWAFFLSNFSGFGITAGAHRLWAHRTYKAKFPLRVFLIILNSMSFQFTVYSWVRDHRTHHKFVDTNADPYNAKRGFFFSHVGWLLCMKHPDVAKKGSTIDMTDVSDDPVVQFQKRYFFPMVFLWSFAFPMLVPMYFWGETLNNAWHVGVILRLCYSEHMTALVNSAAHYWGTRPYDKFLTARENPIIGVLALGEGWHNYHHAFPWDYKVAELGNYRANWTTGFIDFFAKIGWAYDLKTAPLSLVYQRAQRTGENAENSSHANNVVWGWGDKDMSKEDIDDVLIMEKKKA